MDRFQKAYYYSIITQSVTLSDNSSKLVYNKTTGLYDSEGSVKIIEQDLIDGHFPFKFGTIKGTFDCSGLEGLFTLQSGPIQVEKDFLCNNNLNLKSLDKSPKIVKGTYNCSECPNILSLDGATQNIGKDFICDNCTNLATLKGGPQKLSGKFSCKNCISLLNLDGAPYEIGKDFDCTDCKNLNTLKGASKTVGGDMICTGCDALISLEARPKTGGSFKM